MDKEELLKEAKKSIIDADKAKAEELSRRAIAEGMDPLELINKGFRVGIIEVGDLFGRESYFA